MRSALLEDLAAIDSHEIVMTTDTRFTRRMPLGVDSVPVSGASGASETIDALIDASDAVWLIAPETGRCLERLAARVERRGKTLLGSGAAAVRIAADKSRLSSAARTCVGTLRTTVLAQVWAAPTAERRIGYHVSSSRREARVSGCTVSAARARFRRGDRCAHRANRTEPGRRRSRAKDLVMQAFRSVGRRSGSSCDGRRAVPLAVNSQRVTGRGFSYRGGATPFDHPVPTRLAAASRTCAGIPGLRGYVGVDSRVDAFRSRGHRGEPGLTMCIRAARRARRKTSPRWADRVRRNAPAAPVLRTPRTITAAGAGVSGRFARRRWRARVMRPIIGGTLAAPTSRRQDDEGRAEPLVFERHAAALARAASTAIRADRGGGLAGAASTMAVTMTRRYGRLFRDQAGRRALGARRIRRGLSRFSGRGSTAPMGRFGRPP